MVVVEGWIAGSGRWLTSHSSKKQCSQMQIGGHSNRGGTSLSRANGEGTGDGELLPNDSVPRIMSNCPRLGRGALEGHEADACSTSAVMNT